MVAHFCTDEKVIFCPGTRRHFAQKYIQEKHNDFNRNPAFFFFFFLAATDSEK